VAAHWLPFTSMPQAGSAAELAASRKEA